MVKDIQLDKFEIFCLVHFRSEEKSEYLSRIEFIIYFLGGCIENFIGAYEKNQ